MRDCPLQRNRDDTNRGEFSHYRQRGKLCICVSNSDVNVKS